MILLCGLYADETWCIAAVHFTPVTLNFCDVYAADDFDDTSDYQWPLCDLLGINGLPDLPEVAVMAEPTAQECTFDGEGDDIAGSEPSRTVFTRAVSARESFRAVSTLGRSRPLFANHAELAGLEQTQREGLLLQETVLA